VARLIYGFASRVLFGMILTIHFVGHRRGERGQGYFGGLDDLCVPSASAKSGTSVAVALPAVIIPRVWAGVCLDRHPAAFYWVSLVGIVREESCAAATSNISRPARALGVYQAPSCTAFAPNAMVGDHDLPAIHLVASVMTLTAIDLLGFGLQPARRRSAEAAGAGQDKHPGHVDWPGRLFLG